MVGSNWMVLPTNGSVCQSHGWARVVGWHRALLVVLLVSRLQLKRASRQAVYSALVIEAGHPERWTRQATPLMKRPPGAGRSEMVVPANVAMLPPSVGNPLEMDALCCASFAAI